MRIKELTELRRNPHHPLQQKQDTLSLIKQYYEKYGDELYVHFTNTNKIGIHPLYKWGPSRLGLYATPSGIYAYPANFLLLFTDDPIRIRYLFGADRSFVYFLTPTPGINIVDVDSYDQLLENAITNLYTKLGSKPKLHKLFPYFEQLRDLLWKVQGSRSITPTFKQSYSNLFNSILRSAHIDALIDNFGRMSRDIPHQIVFLRKEACQIVGHEINRLELKSASQYKSLSK